ncbi:MAG: hypothetical protein KatS3mg115_0786 [Candidatus Poribacteria bacterium]|nr:MAG: hypothetical protein KatS3mg115_0786 [Candidatus Poribacteria bacterium]
MAHRQPEPEARRSSNRLLYWIIGAIVVGVLVGGFLPSWGTKTYFLGELFLNALKMIVVPLVLFSMIVGITSLGDVRRLGPIGGRTILYYMLTTGLSVLLGLILVNLIRPGAGLGHGEEHPDVAYRLDPNDFRRVIVPEGTWSRTRPENYVGKYVLILTDQNVQGVITAIDSSSATVRFWERRGAEEVIYIVSEDGQRLPFRRVNGELVSAEPQVRPEGRGLAIDVPVAERGARQGAADDRGDAPRGGPWSDSQQRF